MAHSHEKITYGKNELKELFNACVLTGTIVEVDMDNDKADVNISGLGQRNDVPIFYHCEGESTTEGGASAFEEGDNVYILNKEGRINPGSSDLKIVGFVDGLKVCEFYIDITINGKQPEYIKSLKIVDDNDEEHFASSSEDDPNDDLKKPWKVGPFSGVAWPAKIYLYYEGGYAEEDPFLGIVFSYFKTPGDMYHCAIKRICMGIENPQRYYLACGFGATCLAGGGEEVEFILPADVVEYLLHGTFSKKPIIPLNFIAKILKKIHIDSHISYVKNVAGHFPGAPSCSGALYYEGHGLNDMGIMTDEDGQNPEFNGATVTTTEGTYSWEMIPTPGDKI